MPAVTTWACAKLSRSLEEVMNTKVWEICGTTAGWGFGDFDGDFRGETCTWSGYSLP